MVSNPPPVQQVRTNHLGYDLGSGSGSATHHFQIFAKVNGATKTIDVASEWTETDLKAALSAKTGRFLGAESYFVASGGRAMNDGGVTTIGQHGVGKGSQLELRFRARGGGYILARLSRPDRGAEKVVVETASTSEPASVAGQSADVITLGQASYTSEPQHLTHFSSIPSLRGLNRSLPPPQ